MKEYILDNSIIEAEEFTKKVILFKQQKGNNEKNNNNLFDRNFYPDNAGSSSG